MRGYVHHHQSSMMDHLQDHHLVPDTTVFLHCSLRFDEVSASCSSHVRHHSNSMWKCSMYSSRSCWWHYSVSCSHCCLAAASCFGWCSKSMLWYVKVVTTTTTTLRRSTGKTCRALCSIVYWFIGCSCFVVILLRYYEVYLCRCYLPVDQLLSFGSASRFQAWLILALLLLLRSWWYLTAQRVCNQESWSRTHSDDAL